SNTKVRVYHEEASYEASANGDGTAVVEVAAQQEGVYLFQAEAILIGSDLAKSDSITLPPVVVTGSGGLDVEDIARIAREIANHQWDFNGDGEATTLTDYQEDLQYLLSGIRTTHPYIPIPSANLSS